jgi:hypothetical protein
MSVDSVRELPESSRNYQSEAPRQAAVQGSWIDAIESDVNSFTFSSLSWSHVTFCAAAAAAKAAETAKVARKPLSKLVIVSTNA